MNQRIGNISIYIHTSGCVDAKAIASADANANAANNANNANANDANNANNANANNANA